MHMVLKVDISWNKETAKKVVLEISSCKRDVSVFMDDRLYQLLHTGAAASARNVEQHVQEQRTSLMGEIVYCTDYTTF